jgi:hypothetical protein
MARTTKRASPSGMRLPQPEETANIAVKRTAKASPWRALVEGKRDKVYM